MPKYEAFKVSYAVVKDTTSIPTQPQNKVTILMDAQSASAERAISIVKKNLIEQGNLSREGEPVDSISARRLKVFESTRLDDLGDTIVAD